MFNAAAVIALVLMPVSALSADYPHAECALDKDKSSVLIMASNPDDQSYKCMATCKASMTGQRAFKPIECNFNLPKNAAEKAVCDIDGGTPDFFTKVSPTRFTCVPR
ncbi:MAG: hypothetical protein JWQ89_2903 [Devosia sp.]|uniref:hypothetical protein n=1 Tax=Devosia sp. TaxID=1871048 RepID=UPI00261CBEA1|nr:hypothetical protein [Devosia sp.]MDB5541176.1 hypothetical protein [Devosia sp.]